MMKIKLQKSNSICNREVVQITACFRVQLISNGNQITIELSQVICNLTSDTHLTTMEIYDGSYSALTSDKDNVIKQSQ